MLAKIEPPSLAALRSAFQQGNLTLYLGAGVSVGSGLPSWNQLVLAMYFTAVHSDWRARWRPYPNYLYAIAEWQLKRTHEPLEITARKIRQFYTGDTEFLNDLKETLYAGFEAESGFWSRSNTPAQLRTGNPTLDGVAEVCAHTLLNGPGLMAVVTYNYDSLVEATTKSCACKWKPIWKSAEVVKDGARPIIHVHGYIPAIGTGSPLEDVVFTEQQYHAAAHSPYSWSNLSQIQCLTSSVGLMVGLSLSDRNMRRLLDAVRVTPLHKQQFAILERPRSEEPKARDLEKIHKSAIGYMNRFAKSGAKVKGSGRAEQMLDIFKELDAFETANYTQMLEGLGITPIWYSHGKHEEVGPLLRSIVT